MRVNLSKAELHVCRMLGIMRRTSASDKVVDQQMGDQNPWVIDMDGMIGEYCVAKELNLCPDLTVGPRSGGKDLETFNGRSIDVKTTRYKNGKLLCTRSKSEDPCDIYVLVIVDDCGGTIAGWAKSADIFLDKNLQDLGHGVGYAITQENLDHNIEKLVYQ